MQWKMRTKSGELVCVCVTTPACRRPPVQGRARSTAPPPPAQPRLSLPSASSLPCCTACRNMRGRCRKTGSTARGCLYPQNKPGRRRLIPRSRQPGSPAASHRTAVLGRGNGGGGRGDQQGVQHGWVELLCRWAVGLDRVSQPCGAGQQLADGGGARQPVGLPGRPDGPDLATRSTVKGG